MTTTDHKCYVVNEQGHALRVNGTWGSISRLTLYFPNVTAMNVYFKASKLKPCLRWV